MLIRKSYSLLRTFRLPGVKFTFCKDTIEDVEKAEKYVVETLRSRNWIDYILASYIPKQLRGSFCAIQLFNLQLIKISDHIREPSLGLGRLQFWRNTINRIYNGQKPTPEPISISLNHAIHNNPLTKGYFERIIDARAEQLISRNIQDMKKMFQLSQNTYSTLIALNLELLRIDIEKEHEELITKMGHCIGICSYLRRVPFGLRNYRFLVPLDILAKYNVQPMKIWDKHYGKPSQDFFDAVLEISSYSKRAFEDSVQIYENLTVKNQIHPQAFRAFLKGVEMEVFLKDLEKYNFNLFEPGLNSGTNLVKLPTRLYKAAKNKKFYYDGKID